MELNEILKTAVDRGASDVHLSPLTPPIIRFNTRLIELNDTVLEKEELEQMALGILGDKAHRVFMVEGEIDTSYRIEGGKFSRKYLSSPGNGGHSGAYYPDKNS